MGMATREEAKKAILAEVDAALGTDNLTVVERMAARLSRDLAPAIEETIRVMMAEAVDAADDLSLAQAEDFARRRAEIRAAQKVRRGA